jgi:ABC-2 type transport system permease protein
VTSGPRAELFRIVLRLQRRQAAAWIAGLTLVGISGVAGYRTAYPTQAARDAIAHSIGSNPAFNALYGEPHRLQTVTGFAAWRLGGIFVVITGVWGLLAATRLTRGEEEAGRAELMLAGAVTPMQRMGAELASLVVVYLVAWTMLTAGLSGAGTPSGGAALVAFAIVVGAVAFAALGAATGELFGTRRLAAGVAGIVLGASALLRIVADGTAHAGLRWLTPLGWVEEIRPSEGGRPLPVALLAVWTLGWATVAVRVRRERDHGAGYLEESATPRSSMALLGSPEGFALRSSLGVALAWTGGMAAFAAVLGSLARDVARFTADSPDTARIFARLGVGGTTLSVAYLALAFTSLLAPMTFYAVSVVVAGRHEEAEGRLELVLAQGVGRRRWLAGRLLVATTYVALVSIVAGAGAWLGTRLHPVDVGLGAMVKAGANGLPAMLVFVGLAALAFAFAPRLTGPVAYGAVLGAYTLEIVGQLLRWPAWVLGLSPFHHVAAVPLRPVDTGDSMVLLVVAVVFIGVALVRFGRRDITVA